MTDTRINQDAPLELKPFSLERMVRAVERVRERLEKITRILNEHQIPYAVAGGNAVAAWVARIDEAAVRNTQDVDILIRREDLARVIAAAEANGFVHRHAAGIDMLMEVGETKARHAVHLLFAGEKVKQEYVLPTASIDEFEIDHDRRILELEALVRMKLTSFRRKDQVHILDMIDVGLIDQSWTDRFPEVLADRLQELLDDPEG